MPKLKSRKREMFAIEVASMTPYDRAYVLAGYTDSLWARYNAAKLAQVPEVAQRIEELLKDFAVYSGIHAAYLQRQILPLVEANLRDFYEPVLDDHGKKVGDRLKVISDLPRNLAAAITRVKYDPESGRPVEVILSNKIEAASTLLRSLPGGGQDDRPDIGPVSFNFHWGAEGDISNDLPLQLAAKAETERAVAAAERLRTDPAAKARLMAMVEEMNRDSDA